MVVVVVLGFLVDSRPIVLRGRERFIGGDLCGRLLVVGHDSVDRENGGCTADSSQ